MLTKIKNLLFENHSQKQKIAKKTKKTHANIHPKINSSRQGRTYGFSCGSVLRLIAAGKSSREVGEALVLSVRTVERHIANIYLKTDTHGRAQATAYALARGIL